MSKKEQFEDLEENSQENLKDLNNEIITEKNKDEYIAKLNNDLLEQKKKAEEYFDSLKRNMADFDNFKKRMTKERENVFNTVTSDILEMFLPIMDNFETALETNTKDEAFKEGIDMIYIQLKEVLIKLGLEEIVCINTVFDPELHEAVMHEEDENYGEKEIIQVLRKGYKLKDKVIRHAMVKVAN